jgi:hypothetical protein
MSACYRDSGTAREPNGFGPPKGCTSLKPQVGANRVMTYAVVAVAILEQGLAN